MIRRKNSVGAWLLILLTFNAGAETLRIGVSVLPLESVVEAIGGDAVEARSLQREGDSCSVFEPRPSAVAWLAEAEVYLRTGVAYETVLMHKIEDRFPTLEVVDLRQSASHPSVEAVHDHSGQVCSGDHAHHDQHVDDAHDHAHHDHDHAHVHLESDESHLWLDPVELARVGRMVAAVIIEKRPHLRETVEANLRAYLGRAEALEKEIAVALEAHHGRSFMIYHAALSLYAERYGLRQISILGSGGSGPRALAERIEEARAEGIGAILVQPQEDQRQAAIVAAALEATLVEIDPMQRDWEANLRDITSALVRVFEQAPPRSGE
jgi:zinc transport system substrate-binding protein